MDVTDVGNVTQPNGVGIDLAVRQRLTLQHFQKPDTLVMWSAPHNSDARLPDSGESPSDLLFEVAYGCAALKWWGDPAFRALIQNRIHGDGDGNGNRGGGGNVVVTRVETVLNVLPGGRRRKIKRPTLTGLTWSMHCGCKMQGRIGVKPR
jgi:hypothetical protein